MKASNCPLLTFSSPPTLLSGAGVVGYPESLGPYARFFDFHDARRSLSFGEKSCEQAEARSARMALSFALKKAHLSEDDLSLILHGDLQNQLMGSTPAAEGIPAAGLFSACASFGEGLLLGAMATSFFPYVGVLASSHQGVTERQFRNPLEYGGQRAPSAQYTASAAGAVILSQSSGGGDGGERPILIRRGLFGRVINSSVKDGGNMGAAMAPAAADTVARYFAATGEDPRDFTLLTGDLGEVGCELFGRLLSEKLPSLPAHIDGGRSFYPPSLDTHAGGSGAGLIASLLSSGALRHLLNHSKKGRLLALPTGALLSRLSLLQGGTIFGVAHLIEFSFSPEKE